MSAKEPIFGDAARRRFLAGVDTLADAVKVTLGPCGRNVLIDLLDGATAPGAFKGERTLAYEITAAAK